MGKRFDRWLPVTLTENEILERSKALAETLQTKRRVENEKANEMRNYGEQLKDLAGEIAKLGQVVATGEESRSVNCEQRHNEGRIEVVRLDTGEVIESREASGDELQNDLF